LYYKIGKTMENIEKLGNTIIYLSEKIPQLSKTKLLKLLYLLDEYSIKEYGIPFLGLEYEIWKLGPVPRDLYIALSENNQLGELSKYIKLIFNKNGEANIVSNQKFNDDEFSQNDLKLLSFIANFFANYSAKELVNILHNKEKLWYKTAQKNNLIDKFSSQTTNSSTHKINFEDLFSQQDYRLNIYKEHKDLNSFFNSLK